MEDSHTSDGFAVHPDLAAHEYLRLVALKRGSMSSASFKEMASNCTELVELVESQSIKVNPCVTCETYLMLVSPSNCNRDPKVTV